MKTLEPVRIETSRLILRQWQERDLAPFAQMNQDPRVMEHFPSLLTPAESQAMIGRLQSHMDEYGFGFWACEVRQSNEFIGFVGIAHVLFEAPFVPAVEIGWRLKAEAWGRGYAQEAAKACLTYGFNQLHLKEIVAFTVPANSRSRNVMEKIGMKQDLNGDFAHPRVPHDHLLSRHVLYRIHA